MDNNCMDKVFASPIFWTFMGLQAVGTGGFIVLAVTMDIKYMDEEDSPGTTFIAINTILAVPVACFCFLFAGAAFFNVFHKISCKNIGSSLPALPGKSKIASLTTSKPQDSQSMV